MQACSKNTSDKYCNCVFIIIIVYTHNKLHEGLYK